MLEWHLTLDIITNKEVIAVAVKDVGTNWNRDTRNAIDENDKNLQRQINDLVLGSGDSNAEVVQARGGERTLNDRLDKTDTKIDNDLNSVNQQLAQTTQEISDLKAHKADKSEVTNLVGQMQSGVKGTYTTHADLVAAFPNGASGNYVVAQNSNGSVNGYIFTWDGAKWASTGIRYQSTGIANNSISVKHTDFFNQINHFNKDSANNVFDAYITANGVGSDPLYMYSHLIPVKAGDVVNVITAFKSSNRGVFADASGKVILNTISTSDVTQHNGYYTFTVPDNPSIAYFRFNDFKSPSETRDRYYDNSMVVINQEVNPTEYVKYQEKSLKNDITFNANQKNILEAMPLNNRQASEVKEIADDSIFVKNHFNKDSANNVFGSFITAHQGEVSDDPFMYSHPIPIKPGDIVNIVTDYDYTNRAVFTDIDGNIILNTINNNSVIKHEGYYTFTVPDNPSIAYFRFNDLRYPASHRKYYADTMVIINQPVNPDYYIGFGERGLKEDIKFNSNQLANINPLYGKIALFNGDSICAGAGYAGGYPKIIGENNNMNVVNYGVSGGTIAGETYYADSSARHWIGLDVPNMQTEADYVIFEGGINDYWQRVPLGEITPDYNTDFDTTTFCGAFENMLKEAVLKWKGKKIGFIIVHKINENFYPYGYHEPGRFEVYREKIIEMCEKWSIPYLDLFNLSGLNTNLPEIKNLYFKDGDGGHPNEEGYRLFYVPKIEAWMKTL